MTTIARGISKKVAYKKETPGAWGVLNGATGSKYLRRVTSSFNLTKEVLESNEIRTDYQVADARHGVRTVDGSLSGELSPTSYADFMASALARDFTTGGTATGIEVTIAASGVFYTVTRTAGSWITDGFFVGNVVALTGAGLNAANAGNNMLVASMTATVLTVVALTGTPLVAEGPITPVGATALGKQTFTPKTAHTDDSYTFEEWYSDIAQSEVYTGNKVGKMDVKLPSTGLVTIDFGFKGKDRAQTGTSQYFTTPTASGTDGIFSAVAGAMVVDGVPVALITSLDFSLDRGNEAANVVGSNVAAAIFNGRVKVTGNFSTYFQDAVFRDYFDNEQTVSLVVALSTGEEKNADVVAFAMPKVLPNSSTRDDKEMGLMQSHSFQALLNDDTTGGKIETTLFVQDTSL